MTRIILGPLLAVVAVLISGCGGGSLQLQEMEDNDRALVYGFIDMRDAPSDLKWVKIKQVTPETKKPYIYMGVKDGAFFLDNLKPGSYQLANFGGTKWFLLQERMYNYNFPDFGRNETGLRVTHGGLYYLGSYKYKKAGSFFNPKFDMAKAATPTEADVLEKVLPYSTGTRWERLIQARLRALGK